jgi:hypothetical protein
MEKIELYEIIQEKMEYCRGPNRTMYLMVPTMLQPISFLLPLIFF